MSQSQSSIAVDALSRAGIEAARALLDVFGEVARAAAAANPLLAPTQRRCCDIPPACWLPRSLGEHSSEACPCGTALVRLRVTNCQPTESTVSVHAATDSELPVEIVPAAATLGPMERKWFTVSVSIPADACKGECHEILIRVDGCNEHYLRWTVKVAHGACGSCRELEVEDCPDYVHHWYDHFYCVRPCFTAKRKEG